MGETLGCTRALAAFAVESAARIEDLPSLAPLMERLSPAGRAAGGERTSKAGG